jgi:excisionase family DNA binding protein
MNDRLLDAAEVAERLNVPTSWPLEMARSSRIPHVRLGRYVRFVWTDVEAWLESCKQNGSPTTFRHAACRSVEERGRRASARDLACARRHPHPSLPGDALQSRLRLRVRAPTDRGAARSRSLPRAAPQGARESRHPKPRPSSSVPRRPPRCADASRADVGSVRARGDGSRGAPLVRHHEEVLALGRSGVPDTAAALPNFLPI